MNFRVNRRRLVLCALALSTLIGVLYWRILRAADVQVVASETIASKDTTPAPTTPLSTPPPGASARPRLSAGVKTERHVWTREDAKAPEVIQLLAHNPDEYARMMEENGRIKRRQLVYRNEPVALLLEQARAEGRALSRITLPAMDGKEVDVEILESNLDGHRGALMGRIVGRLDSVACVGFSGAYESFNLMSPQDGLYIAAEAREPGEIILKEIDPAVYSPMACGGPLTAQN